MKARSAKGGPVHDANEVDGKIVLNCTGRKVDFGNYNDVQDAETTCIKCVEADCRKRALIWRSPENWRLPYSIYRNSILCNNPDDKTFEIRQFSIAVLGGVTLEELESFVAAIRKAQEG